MADLRLGGMWTDGLIDRLIFEQGAYWTGAALAQSRFDPMASVRWHDPASDAIGAPSALIGRATAQRGQKRQRRPSGD